MGKVILAYLMGLAAPLFFIFAKTYSNVSQGASYTPFVLLVIATVILCGILIEKLWDE